MSHRAAAAYHVVSTHMPIHAVYESMIASAGATFGFSEFACDPDEITASLGVTPDDFARKGDEFTGSDGKRRAYPISSWSISSSSTSKDVNDHLRFLLARLAGKEMHIRPEFGTPSFMIVWRAAFLHQATGPFFEADVLRGIASLDAELYQEIHEVNEGEC